MMGSVVRVRGRGGDRTRGVDRYGGDKGGDDERAQLQEDIESSMRHTIHITRKPIRSNKCRKLVTTAGRQIALGSISRTKLSLAVHSYTRTIEYI
jgi:hypothetical protein